MSYVRDYDTDEPPCFCAPQAIDPLGATAEFCPACGNPDKPFPLPEYDEPGVADTEPERSGWYCPDCAKETEHILCDGCKTLICNVCGYPCACGDLEEAYATAKAENDFAADLGPEA